MSIQRFLMKDAFSLLGSWTFSNRPFGYFRPWRLTATKSKEKKGSPLGDGRGLDRRCNFWETNYWEVKEWISFSHAKGSLASVRLRWFLHISPFDISRFARAALASCAALRNLCGRALVQSSLFPTPSPTLSHSLFVLHRPCFGFATLFFLLCQR